MARKYAPRLPPEKRREQLLDASLRLIVEHGYGGVTMEGVAREAQVTKPVVYDAFGSLGALLRALVEREERRALAQLAALIPSAPGDDVDPDQLLIDSVTGYLRAVAEHPDTWRTILLPVEGTPPIVREHVDRGRRTVMEQIQALTAWGLDRRGGPSGLDVELTGYAIRALAEDMARLVLTEPERFTPERVAAFTARLLAALGRG